MAYCYLLRFSKPLGNDNHSAQFYLGYTSKSLKQRLAEHRNGDGAAITRYAVKQGIELELVAYWRDATRQLERCLKNYKNHRCLLNSKKHKPDKIIGN